MKSRVLLSILVFSLVGLVYAGGQGEQQGGEASQGPIELTLWHETEPAIADALKQELKALEPEIVVNVVRKEKVTEALKLAAGDPSASPDLFWFAHDKIGLFATIGALEPLDTVMTEDARAGFVPMANEAVSFNGRPYMVPATFETLLFMYNKDLMTTPPRTTDELLSLMESQTTEDQYVYVEQHSTAYYAAAWINGFGGYIINGQAEPGLNLDETVQAVDYHSRFVDYMPIDGEWNTVTTLFTEGKAASTLNGPWLIPAVREKGINLGFAPMPVIDEVGEPLKPFTGVQGLMVVSSSPNKEAALRVAEFVTSKGLGERLALATGAAPAHLEAYNNPEIRGNELIMAIRGAGEAATPMPNVPEMDVMWVTTETALVNVNKQGRDPQAELDKAQADSEQKIRDMQ
ncbi:extracellular solute-binding protein [Spirochaeta lutea]|nr:extracellular solute-binding protein [Spirochaeta lutea]